MVALTVDVKAETMAWHLVDRMVGYWVDLKVVTRAPLMVQLMADTRV